VAQGKGQMIGKLVARLVAFIENAKTTLLAPTTANMFPRDTAWLPNGRLQAERLDKRRPTGELRPLWNDLALETDWRF
jgi:hypothetical protein